MPLFEKVLYHVSQSLTDHTRHEISRILDINGAAEVPVDRATHVLSDTIEFEGCDVLGKDVACVTPYWVERSMELGQLQDPKYFSADKEMFFSGVVATSADLPVGDKEVIASGVLAQGGAWREGLTRDVTHLFVTNTSSQKYQTAMHFRDSAHITIVLPQWFDQCWSTQMRLPPDVFQFPDPPYLRNDHDIAAYKAQLLDKKHRVDDQHVAGGFDKQAMFRTMQGSDASSPPISRPRNIWQGRSILLSPSLGLDAQRRESVEARIRRTGGVVIIVEDDDESSVVKQADIFITRYRAGPAYATALDEGKTIGTLAWLFYVERSGVLSRPRDQLLHYPVRSKPIVGFADHEITVTNYQGEAREYIKKLIEIMGAKFTPTMSGRNTIVIAAYKGGNKTDKAEEWSVPVVTHKWLEDCFVEWRNLTPAQKKYLDYAPGVNYGTILGDRGVGRVGLAEDPELPPETREAQLPANNPADKHKTNKSNNAEAKSAEAKKSGDGEEFPGIMRSMPEALELEEVEDVLHLGQDYDEGHVDAEENPPPSPTKIGPPRGIKKTPTKKAKAVASPPTKPKSTPTSRNHTEGPLPATKATPLSMSRTTPPVCVEPNNSLNAMVQRADSDEGPTPVKENALLEASPLITPSRSVKLAQRGKERLAPGAIHVSKPRSKPKPNSVMAEMQRKSSPLDDDDSTSDERDNRAKGKAHATHVGSANESGEDRSRLRPKPGPKSMAPKSKARASTPMDVDSDDEKRSGVHETPLKVVKPGLKPDRVKATPKTKPKVFALESGSDDDIRKSPPKKTVVKTYGSTDKGKRKAAPQPSPTRIVSVDLPSPRSLLRSIPRPRSPEEIHSVSKPQTPQARAITRTTSMRASAHEVKASPSMRGRPSVTWDVSPRPSTPSPHRSSHRHPSDSPHVTKPKHVGQKAAKAASTSSIASSTSPPPTQRTSSRRPAAEAATQKLRNEVMPDVMNYQNERKRDMRGGLGGRRRRHSQADSRSDEDEMVDDNSDMEARLRKRRKVATEDGTKGTGKGKANGKAAEEESDTARRKHSQVHSRSDEDEMVDDKSDLEVRVQKRHKVAKDDGSKGKGKGKSKGKATRKAAEEQSDTPPQRFVTHINKVKKPVHEDVEAGLSEGGPRKKARFENPESGERSEDENSFRQSSCDPKKVRILTTKIVVPDHLEKALTKLGVKFTEKPQECTHLVTQALSRTEKLLCALPNVPFVLSVEWLIACAEYKVVVAESDFFLHDPDMEHKHKFKLSEALDRARELKRKKKKLLQGQFFYVTPHIVPEFKLLKNVLQALGAECKQATPTLRNLSETRHVISGWKDAELWRPLVKAGVTVYSHELILGAAFTQYVDWDGEDKILARGA